MPRFFSATSTSPMRWTITGARPSVGSSSRRIFAPVRRIAGDGEHLLLAAGQLRALARAPLVEVREERVDLLDAHAALRDLGRQHQVLGDVEAREDAALLGHVAEPGLGDLVERQAAGGPCRAGG